jgi:hypothetical protein
MFIGHEGLAFAAKPAERRVSLGTLVAAAQLPDLLWPIFLLLGWEHVKIVPGHAAASPLVFTSYPISHSLVAMVGWGLAFGGAYYLVRRYLRGAVVIALLVVSHWFLDVIVHTPDLPLVPGGSKFGLGLWNSIPATLAVEGLLFMICLAIYVRTTPARDRIGSIGLWSFVIFIVAVWLSGLYMPPPPSGRAIGWAGLAMWLLPFWAGWFDRHRGSAIGA